MSGQWKRNIFLAAGFYGAEVGGNIEFVPLQILTQWKRQKDVYKYIGKDKHKDKDKYK